MISFQKMIIDKTVERLLNGEDYREEIINSINISFLDFTVDFFKHIVDAKMNDKEINLDWYRSNFINNELLPPEECAIYAGLNKKTVTNIYGSAKREILLDAANNNFEYLANLVSNLEDDRNTGLNIILKIEYKNISVELSLMESLLVINALATKKIAIRGGAWSSIGKKVEKPLMLALCNYANVPREYINDEVFKQDGTLDYDREVDFKLYNADKTCEYRVEVKLMGRGNPESADAVIARDSKIFVADTLSQQNKNQLDSLDIEWVELKNNLDAKSKFVYILNKLNIPCKKFGFV